MTLINDQQREAKKTALLNDLSETNKNLNSIALEFQTKSYTN